MIPSSLSAAFTTAALWLTLARRPSSAEAVVREQKPIKPKTFYLAVLAFQSLVYLIAFGEDPLGKIYLPEQFKLAYTIGTKIIPIGLPILAVLSVGVFVLVPACVAALLPGRASIRTIVDVGMLDAGVFTVSGLAVLSLAMYIYDPFGLNLDVALLILAWSLYVLRWRYVQIRWLLGLNRLWSLSVLAGLTFIIGTYGWLSSRYFLTTWKTDRWDMKPSLLDGDIVLVSRYDLFLAQPEVGQIYIVCSVQNICKASRLIGMKNDKVQIIAGKLTRNGNTMPAILAGTYKEHWGMRKRKEISWPLYLETLDNGSSHFFTEMSTVSDVRFRADRVPSVLWNVESEVSGRLYNNRYALAADGIPALLSGSEISLTPLQPLEQTPVIEVPSGRYLFVDDLRSVGYSKEGPFIMATRKEIIGHVFYRLWPLRYRLDDVSAQSETRTREGEGL